MNPNWLLAAFVAGNRTVRKPMTHRDLISDNLYYTFRIWYWTQVFEENLTHDPRWADLDWRTRPRQNILIQRHHLNLHEIIEPKTKKKTNTQMQTEIRHQIMPNTNGLIQSSCVLEIDEVQYLIKIIAPKKAIQINPIVASELAGMFPPENARFIATFEV